MDKVRIAMSAKTAGMAGIGFVAVTRVRHPRDLIFWRDLPAYEDFQKQREKKNFRARRRFELRLEAKASRTLRRYGFCAEDRWSRAEARAAEDLLGKLWERGELRRAELRMASRDADACLWREGPCPIARFMEGAVGDLGAEALVRPEDPEVVDRHATR